MKNTIKRTTTQQHQDLINTWNLCLKEIPHLFTQTQLNQIQALYVQHGYYELLQLFHVEINNEIAGAFGIANNKVEMILISPRYMRQGICSQLVKHVVDLGVYYVDVSEHHQILFQIFVQHGFEIMARSEVDAEGCSNPILHLMKPHLATRFSDDD
ncbi:GNAT family N-acetyltransferase [Acinetobacter sp. 194]|uniref:GNAT family N-acetyltransferase n=1 Tax=Acinetobacter shaoyimingii TaxID=2715164 RepID=UPI00140CB511|nr:GNAT family N-acetyltransferase [Acinetobacter shaoyimingii]NHB56616.1 GNAT family N-acetyltransferase [Acinetobacter shaoyimingii]